MTLVEEISGLLHPLCRIVGEYDAPVLTFMPSERVMVTQLLDRERATFKLGQGGAVVAESSPLPRSGKIWVHLRINEVHTGNMHIGVRRAGTFVEAFDPSGRQWRGGQTNRRLTGTKRLDSLQQRAFCWGSSPGLPWATVARQGRHPALPRQGEARDDHRRRECATAKAAGVRGSPRIHRRTIKR